MSSFCVTINVHAGALGYWRSVKRIPGVCPALIMAILLSGMVGTGNPRAAESQISYKDLQGARRVNPDNHTWEVGWKVPSFKRTRTWIYPVKGLEGVFFRSFSKVGKGNRLLCAHDLGLDRGQGFPLPLLGIKSDFYVLTKRDVECPVRYYADNGDIALEWWTSGYYSNVYIGGKPEQIAWLKSNGCTAERLKRMGGMQFRMSVRCAPFDSRWLDSNHDGRWQAKTFMKIRNYQLPLNLEYVMFLPATTVEVPMDSAWKQGACLTFRFLAEKGEHTASLLLDPEYMPDTGKLRIGFAGNKSDYVYVVQNPARGREGIIVGRVKGMNGRLSIVPGSLRIMDAKWVPYDRVAVDKRKWVGREASPMDDFTAFAERANRDWGYLIAYETRPGTKFGGKAFPLRNVYNRVRRDQVAREKADALRIAYKYGIRVSLDIGGFKTPGNYIPDMYKGEVLDPRTGTFVKALFLDWANPAAVAWEQENIKRRVRPYRGTATYLQVHEGWGKFESGNMSSHALASFRAFTGDAKAKFPVVPTSPNTERTTNTPSPELIRKYKLWKLGYYRGEKVMLAFLRAGYEVFKGSGSFKGVGYFGAVTDGGAYFVPYLAAGREVAMLCPENVSSGTQPAFKVWLDAVRKSGGRIDLLPHSYPMLVNSSADRFIEWFTSVGLRPEVHGLILGGGGLVPQTLFEALAAKHFGRGRMSVSEAEAWIRTIRCQGIYALDDYSRRRLDRDRKSYRRPFSITTARRISAVATKIIVDGRLGEWDRAAWVKVRKSDNLFVRKDWEGPDDLSFSFAVTFTRKSLYLAIRVSDDRLIAREQTMSPSADEVDLFVGFTPDPRKRKLVRGENALQFRIFPSGRKDVLYLGSRFVTAVPGSEVASRLVSGGYEIEAMIPCEHYGYIPRKGDLVPLDVYVIDADEPGGGCSAAMLWNMFAGKKAPWKTTGTSQWGLIELR